MTSLSLCNTIPPGQEGVMVVLTVEVWVKPEGISRFIECCKANHKGTRKEAGNLRFDVLQNPAEPGRFLLYEAYKSQADVEAHKKTEHYAAWRDGVADLMAS